MFQMFFGGGFFLRVRLFYILFLHWQYRAHIHTQIKMKILSWPWKTCRWRKNSETSFGFELFWFSDAIRGNNPLYSRYLHFLQALSWQFRKKSKDILFMIFPLKLSADPFSDVLTFLRRSKDWKEIRKENSAFEMKMWKAAAVRTRERE